MKKHVRALIAVNNLGRVYDLAGGKKMGFDYLWNKGLRLEAWLLANNELPGRRLFGTQHGTKAAFDTYCALVWQVEQYCGLWGVVCTAMLCEGLTGLEGALVRVTWPNGKKSEGFIQRRGRAIKYHMIVKDGNINGAKIDPWRFEGAAVEVISREAVHTIDEFPAWLRA